MGDIADMLFEQGIAQLDDPCFQDELSEVEHSYVGMESRTRCKFCGQDGLEWYRTGNGWRMVDSNYEPHSCQKYWLERGE